MFSSAEIFSQNPDYRVVFIPEILALILTLLSPHDLLVNAQRVNRQWAIAIKESTALQQRLWFSAPTKTELQQTFNPLILINFPLFYYKSHSFNFYSKPSRMHLSFGENTPLGFMDASWRLIYPSSNLFSTLTLVKTTGWQRSAGILCAVLRREEGWKMGPLYDVVKQIVERMATATTWVEWKLEWERIEDEAGTEPRKEDLLLRLNVDFDASEVADGMYMLPGDEVYHEGKEDFTVTWWPYDADYPRGQRGWETIDVRHAGQTLNN